MTFREFLRSLVEDWNARKRGEIRVAPRGARGRIFAKKDGSVEGRPGELIAKTRPTATISARVYRAATDTWEDHGVISEPER